MKGKLIVLYGINNLGKSTQAKMLVDRLNAEGIKARYLKYPIYDLEPSGPILNAYLRQGNPLKLSPREAQIFYTLNRTQFQPTLKSWLEQGEIIIAEDYTGTGLAWGIGAGVDEAFLKNANSHLLQEDLAFLFDGQRFTQAIESGHTHETNDELTNIVRTAHQKLGNEFGWLSINANESIEEIHANLWEKIQKLLS